MFYFVFGTLVIGFIFWLIEMRERKCTKVDNTELDHVPTKAAVENHNAQVRQQRIINFRKVQQRISSILDVAYKDYASDKIKKNAYIEKEFILHEGEYGITWDEISAIYQPFTYSIYNVDTAYNDIFNEYVLVVTVDHQRKED
jgi:hypothetical protein